MTMPLPLILPTSPTLPSPAPPAPPHQAWHEALFRAVAAATSAVYDEIRAAIKESLLVVLAPGQVAQQHCTLVLITVRGGGREEGREPMKVAGGGGGERGKVAHSGGSGGDFLYYRTASPPTDDGYGRRRRSPPLTHSLTLRDPLPSCVFTPPAPSSLPCCHTDWLCFSAP